MNRLRLRSRVLPGGTVVSTWLLEEGGDLSVLDETEASVEFHFTDVAVPLPARAVSVVFKRYGRPLAIELPSRDSDDASIRVTSSPDGNAEPDRYVRAFSYRAPVDVIENDYLVLEGKGDESLCGPAPLIADALLAIARAFAPRAPRSGD